MAAAQLPTDPAERRRLWRQWTHVDAPAGDRAVARTLRVARAPATQRRVDDWAEQAIDAPPGMLSGLRHAIAAAIIDGRLAVGDRERLLRRAGQLGLSRFEANLLVAAVQHRAQEAIPATPLRRYVVPRRQRSLVTLLGACLAIEAIATAAAVAWLRA